MFDTGALIDYGGLLIIFLAVYGQTGLFFCFFIPSGGLMFAAGALIASGSFDHSLLTVLILLTVAAVLGNTTGYFFGRKAGPFLYSRKDSKFFRQQYLRKAEGFYRKYGGPALSVGLFFPLIRTFAPIVSGIIRLKFSRFLLFTTIGSVGWIASFLLLGYLIGTMPFLRPYLKYIVLVIIVGVSVPVVIKILREFKNGKVQ